jgi:hypothetical protein
VKKQKEQVGRSGEGAARGPEIDQTHGKTVVPWNKGVLEISRYD